MNNWDELKRLAEKVRELDVVGDDDHDYDPLDEAIERMQSAANSKNILALIEENDRLYDALRALFDSYKGLADSGDAGFWSLEDQPEGRQAIAALYLRKEHGNA